METTNRNQIESRLADVLAEIKQLRADGLPRNKNLLDEMLILRSQIAVFEATDFRASHTLVMPVRKRSRSDAIATGEIDGYYDAL